MEKQTQTFEPITKAKYLNFKIKRHVKQLKELLNLDIKENKEISFFKKIQEFENRLYNYNIKYANNTVSTLAFENITNGIEKEFIFFLCSYGLEKTKILKFNKDPRGYALKIDDSFIHESNKRIYKDFGGYGIFCPDFENDYQNDKKYLKGQDFNEWKK